jgi:hypothetical protein
MVKECDATAWSLSQPLNHTDVIHYIGTTLYLTTLTRHFPSARLSYKTSACNEGDFRFDASWDSKENIYRIVF